MTRDISGSPRRRCRRGRRRAAVEPVLAARNIVIPRWSTCLNTGKCTDPLGWCQRNGNSGPGPRVLSVIRTELTAYAAMSWGSLLARRLRLLGAPCFAARPRVGVRHGELQCLARAAGRPTRLGRFAPARMQNDVSAPCVALLKGGSMGALNRRITITITTATVATVVSLAAGCGELAHPSRKDPHLSQLNPRLSLTPGTGPWLTCETRPSSWPAVPELEAEEQSNSRRRVWRLLQRIGAGHIRL